MVLNSLKCEFLSILFLSVKKLIFKKKRKKDTNEKKIKIEMGGIKLLYQVHPCQKEKNYPINLSSN